MSISLRVPGTKGRLVDLKKGFKALQPAAGIPDFQCEIFVTVTLPGFLTVEGTVAVAELFGHTDVRMTKRYLHAMHERKRQALEKLAATSTLRQMQNGRDVAPAVSA